METCRHLHKQNSVMCFKSLFGAGWMSFNCYQTSHFDLNSCDSEQDNTRLEWGIPAAMPIITTRALKWLAWQPWTPISSEQTCWGLIKFYSSSNSHLQTTFQWEHDKYFMTEPWKRTGQPSGGGIAQNQRKLKVTHLNLISRRGSIEWLNRVAHGETSNWPDKRVVKVSSVVRVFFYFVSESTRCSRLWD